MSSGASGADETVIVNMSLAFDRMLLGVEVVLLFSIANTFSNHLNFWCGFFSILILLIHIIKQSENLLTTSTLSILTSVPSLISSKLQLEFFFISNSFDWSQLLFLPSSVHLLTASNFYAEILTLEMLLFSLSWKTRFGRSSSLSLMLELTHFASVNS